MKLTPKTKPECPAHRALELVGEWWSILILRDAFQGMTRFDEFRESLGIAPNMLARRLSHLTRMGLFARKLYSRKPPRYEYVLTPMGRDFFPVLASLLAWGNRHLTPEGEHLFLAGRTSRQRLDPLVVDAHSLAPLRLEDVRVMAGPKAGPAMKKRIADLAARKAEMH